MEAGYGYKTIGKGEVWCGYNTGGECGVRVVGYNTDSYQGNNRIKIQVPPPRGSGFCVFIFYQQVAPLRGKNGMWLTGKVVIQTTALFFMSKKD